MVHTHTHTHMYESVSCSVMFDSLWHHGLYPTRVLYPWNSPGMNTGVGCHSLLQGIFLTQGSNLGFPHKQADSLLSEPPRKHIYVCIYIYIYIYFHHYCFERKTRNYSKVKKNNKSAWWTSDTILTPCLRSFINHPFIVLWDIFPLRHSCNLWSLLYCIMIFSLTTRPINMQICTGTAHLLTK